MINIPQMLQKEEYRFVLLKSKDKKPFEDDWQNNGYKYDDFSLKEHIQNEGNYGIIAGYGNLRILDIDIPEIADKLIQVLETFTVRSGSGGAHFYFKSEYDKNQVLPNKTGELRCNKYQVVGPSCIHPNGNMYIIIKNIPIMNITIQELERIITPYIPIEIKQETKNVDTSRSGQEFGKLIRLIKQGIKKNKLDKDYIFNEMNFFSKWKEGTQAYREHTWKNAIEHIEEEKNQEEETKKQIQTVGDFIKLDEYMGNAEKFYKKHPFFFDKAKIFWFWNDAEYKWEMRDETDIMNTFETAYNLYGATINSKIKHDYLEAFKRVGRRNIPKETPKKWIQFRNKIFDIESKNTFEATSEYFFCNPIPWDLGETSNTPRIDELFEQWGGKKYKQTLYETIAYSCVTDYPIHIIICLVGSGSNGKTKYITLIENFLGNHNVCSAELDAIVNGRFESSKLFKKLLCTMGETNFDVINKTSKIKKLTGQDSVSMEFKGKDSFDDKNYAKIVIASNGLPISEDTSDGFYRRWLIIDFPNKFLEGKDILATIPQIEYNNLALKCTEILPDLLSNGKFTNQGSLDDRKKRYVEISNPFTDFSKKCCIMDQNSKVKYSELYNAFSHYSLVNKKRVISRKSFSETLGFEGHEVEKTSGRTDEGGWLSTRWIIGLQLKHNWKDFCDPCATCDTISTQTSLMRNRVDLPVQVSQVAQSKPVYELSTFLSQKDRILTFLRQHNQASSQEISDGLGLPVEELDRILEALRTSGDVFEPKHDQWKVL